MNAEMTSLVMVGKFIIFKHSSVAFLLTLQIDSDVYLKLKMIQINKHEAKHGNKLPSKLSEINLCFWH